MEMILYYYKHEGFNFYSVFVKSVCKLFKISLTLVASDYSWSTVGDLPVLQIDSFLFRDQNIIKVLEKTLDLNSQISPDSNATLKEIQSLCHSSIHERLTLLKSKSSSAVKSFESKLTFSKALFENLLKLQNSSSNSNLKPDLDFALRSLKKTHETLSEFLNENDFFSQKFDYYNLHLEDLAIFAYLKEDLFYLGHLEEVRSDFERFENLKRFIRKVEEKLELGQGLRTIQKDSKVFLELSEKRGHFKEIKEKDPFLSYRREFVSITFLTFLGFLLINSR
jgi:hypothetical protein